LLTTRSSRSTSWLITTTPPSCARRKSRSQVIESASRWLVGSSSSSVGAPENRIRASSTRRRWPPDSVPSGWFEHPVGQPEVGADPGRLGLGRVAAERGEPVLEPAVPAHDASRVASSAASASSTWVFSRSCSSVSEAAGGQHPVLAQHGEVAGARVLRQVADLAAPVDGARVRQRLAGEHAQGGGLAGAVAADQPDAVAGLDAQGGAGQQDPGAGTQLQVGGG
jgi:hypothetical protein